MHIYLNHQFAFESKWATSQQNIVLIEIEGDSLALIFFAFRTAVEGSVTLIVICTLRYLWVKLNSNSWSSNQTKTSSIPKQRQYHVKRNRRHCIHRHLRTRGSRHHHWQRIHYFCFQDSIQTPLKTNLPSSNQPGRRRCPCRSRGSCSPHHAQNPGNWKRIPECFLGISSFWVVCFSDVSRSYFTGTRLRCVPTIASSRDKRSSLHFQHRYRLGNWIVHRWTVFFDCISLKSRCRLCRCHWCCVTLLLFGCYLCELPFDPFATVRYKTWITSLLQKINAGPEFASFKDILHSGRCVAYLLVAWFRGVQHQRILLAVFFSKDTLVCQCSTLSKFYGESIRIQF